MSRTARCWCLLIVCWGSSLAGAAEQGMPLPVSPPDQRIAAAQKRVKTSPGSAQAFNDLAFAFWRKARDTEDPKLYNQADGAIQHSLQVAPGNYDARKLQVAIALGKHHYSQALKMAGDLNHSVPDDIAGWGLLMDANMALGNYAEAERAAQWILDLRPGSALGFEKAAGLREIFGDFEGAVEFLDEADRRTSPNDLDQHAWLLTEKARLQLAAGNAKEAEQVLTEALKFYPDSSVANLTLAKLRSAQGRYSDAAQLLEKRYKNVQTPGNLYLWAEALEKEGHQEKATTAFRDFESAAQAAGDSQDRIDLVFFYLDHKRDPGEALSIASKLSAERHDCGTLDAYAWALYNNGRYADAQTQMSRALEPGVRDPVYFCHAAQIAAKANDLASAAKFRHEMGSFNENACPAVRFIPTTSEARR
jgi:tetratricopeptide (TPR) repeat protein